jgi:hypothetical protein
MVFKLRLVCNWAFFTLVLNLLLPCYSIKIEIPDEIQRLIDESEERELKSIQLDQDEVPNNEEVVETIEPISYGPVINLDPVVRIDPVPAESIGIIKGQVFDKDTGESLKGVVILVENTDLGTISDFNGNYRFDGLDSGSYDLTFFKDGYIEAKITDAVVNGEELTVLNFALPPRPVEMSDEVFQLEDFVVTAAEVMSQNAALISLRKQSIGSIEALSSEDFKKYASSSMADAISRVSGASTSDGKYAVIRGLDDRYNSVLLNGILIPSPDPDRKAVALDVFPSKLFSNLIVQKSFTANLPGDSSGGALSMQTKTIPDESFVKISYGLGVKDTYKGDSTYLYDPERPSIYDWLKGNDYRGFSVSDDSSALLNQYPNRVGEVTFPLFSPLSRNFPTFHKQSFSFSTGGNFTINDRLNLGAVFSQNVSSSFSSKFTEVEKIKLVDSTFVATEIGNESTDGGKFGGKEEFSSSTLLSIGANINNQTELGYTYLNISDLSSEANQYFYDIEDYRGESVPGGREVPQGINQKMDSFLGSVQKDIEMNLLNGVHSFSLPILNADSKFSWNYANIFTSQEESDFRSIIDYYVELEGFVSTASLPKYSRYNRLTEQDSQIFNLKFDTFLEDIIGGVDYKMDLGYDVTESEREFTQLEPTGGNGYDLDYVAMPLPDGLEGGYSSNFYDNPLDSQADVVAFFDSKIESWENGELADANRELADAEDQVSAALDEIQGIRSGVDPQVTAWNAAFPDYQLNEDYYITDPEGNIVSLEASGLSGEFLDLGGGFVMPAGFIYDFSLENARNSIDDIEQENVAIFADVEEKQLAVDNIEERINGIEAEKQEMLNFYSQVNQLPSYVDLPDYHFNYTEQRTPSPVAKSNYLLETPLGFGLFASSDAVNNSSYFSDVTYMYRAKGTAKTESIYINNNFKIPLRNNLVLDLSAGIRNEDTLLKYEVLPEREGDFQPASASGVISGFDPLLEESRPIDQRDNNFYITQSIGSNKGDFKLFASYSETRAKPTFREISPFPIFNLADKSVELGNAGVTITNGGQIAQNPDSEPVYLFEDSQFSGLRLSKIKSTDVRFDYYFDEDGILSFGVFKKHIANPIERVLARTINFVEVSTFINNDNNAHLEGFEFEFRKRFDRFAIGGNYTLIDAKIDRSKFEKNALESTKIGASNMIDPDAFQNGSQSSRSLYNQPENIGNIYISYDLEELNTTITLSGNMTGKQLYRTGYSEGSITTPDLYWDDYFSSNLVVLTKLSDTFSVSFSIKNLFSSDRNLSYSEDFTSVFKDRAVYFEGNGTPEYPTVNLGDISEFNRSSYKPERSFSLSVSAEF